MNSPDKILEVEILLDRINTLFAKSVYHKNSALIEKLNSLRQEIYYKELDYEKILNALKKCDVQSH